MAFHIGWHTEVEPMKFHISMWPAYVISVVGIVWASYVGIRRGFGEIRHGQMRWLHRGAWSWKATPPDWLEGRLWRGWFRLPEFPDPGAIKMANRYVKKGKLYGLEVGYSNVNPGSEYLDQFISLMTEKGWTVTKVGERRYEFYKLNWRLKVEPWTKRDLVFVLWHLRYNR